MARTNYKITAQYRGSIFGTPIAPAREYEVVAASIEEAFALLGREYPRSYLFGEQPGWLLERYREDGFYRHHSHSGEDEYDEVVVTSSPVEYIPALEACARGCVNGNPIQCWEEGTPCRYNYRGDPVPLPAPALP